MGVNLTIDGLHVAVEPGSTILRVARDAGIDIPTLCRDERLEPFAACRLCLVEVEGGRTPVVASASQASEGMVVRAETDEVTAQRRVLLDPLLSDHRPEHGAFLPVVYEAPGEEPDDEYPFVPTTGRILEHYHAGTMTRRSDGLDELVPTGFVEVSPADAQRLAITDGGEVTVTTRRGAITTPAWVTDRAAEGVVFVPFHFWEAPANRLTNPARGPQAKIPEFKVCACRVSATT